MTKSIAKSMAKPRSMSESVSRSKEINPLTNSQTELQSLVSVPRSKEINPLTGTSSAPQRNWTSLSTSTKQYLPVLKMHLKKIRHKLSLTHKRKRMLSLHDIYVYLTPSGLKDLFHPVIGLYKYRQGVTLNTSPPNASFSYENIMIKVKKILKASNHFMMNRYPFLYFHGWHKCI